MAIAIITGSAGLVGSESALFFAAQGFEIVGIDNDMRNYFFGQEASTIWSRQRLQHAIKNYEHYDTDIRDIDGLEKIFARYGQSVVLVLHTAAQPSHDWAAKEPLTDFTINANGTMNLLEMTRKYCPEAVFLFTSTNKVYGDTPNRLPLVEHAKRWEVAETHPFHAHGIDESMTIDHSLHSLFGVSKSAADLMVQEYGRYFQMKTMLFRGGCLTGSNHSGAELHGFLAYLVKCAVTGKKYTIFGYHGKQVRDNIHSNDLVNAFWQAFQAPRIAEVYNMGGGRYSNCSIMEAIDICQQVVGKELNWSYTDINRSGDHIWWVSDCRKFAGHYPQWKQVYTLQAIIEELHHGLLDRL